MIAIWTLWTPLAHAEPPEPVLGPIDATTGDGRTAVLRPDGTWALGDLPAEPVSPPLGAPERFGAWAARLGRDPATGRVLGGASAPNLDGPGAVAIVCDGTAAVPLLVAGDADLGAWDPAAVDRGTRPTAAYTIPVRRARRPLAGAIVDLGGVEALVVPAASLLEPLLALEGDTLALTAAEPRPGWPEALRVPLDGFRAAWARVATACAGGP